MTTLKPTGGDDTAVIAAAIAASHPSDTLVFGPGEFQVAQTIALAPGRNYQGQPGAVLRWTGGLGHLAFLGGAGVSISGLTFAGSSLKIETGNALSIAGCTFRDNSLTGNYAGGIFNPAGLQNSQIVNSQFLRLAGYGLITYSPDNTIISGNTFDHCFQGIHGVFFSGGRNCTVSGNVLTHIRRHGIELQDKAQNLIVESNRLSDWDNQFPLGQDHDGHIALSIATGVGARGIIIRNNVVLGTGFSAPDYHFAAIEAMGQQLVVDGNFISNWGSGVLHGIDSGPMITNNTFLGVGRPIVSETGATAPASTAGNIVDVLGARPTPPAAPLLPPQPLVALPSAPTLTHTVSVFDDGSLQVNAAG